VSGLADLDAAVGQLVAGGDDVGHDQMHAGDRFRVGVGDTDTHADRARGSGWGQLHDAELVAGAVVDVADEARLIGVERFGAGPRR